MSRRYPGSISVSKWDTVVTFPLVDLFIMTERVNIYFRMSVIDK
jgi:hypothetical protein